MLYSCTRMAAVGIKVLRFTLTYNTKSSIIKHVAGWSMLLTGNVVDDDSNRWITNVRWNQAAESLLPCSVPQLQANLHNTYSIFTEVMPQSLTEFPSMSTELSVQLQVKPAVNPTTEELRRPSWPWPWIRVQVMDHSSSTSYVPSFIKTFAKFFSETRMNVKNCPVNINYCSHNRTAA